MTDRRAPAPLHAPLPAETKTESARAQGNRADSDKRVRLRSLEAALRANLTKRKQRGGGRPRSGTDGGDGPR